MINRNRANLVLYIHIGWCVLGFLSLPLLFIVPWWYRVTLSLTIGMLISWAALQDCLFVDLENSYRAPNDPARVPDERSFFQHYIEKFFRIRASRTALARLINTYVAILLAISLLELIQQP